MTNKIDDKPIEWERPSDRQCNKCDEFHPSDYWVEVWIDMGITDFACQLCQEIDPRPVIDKVTGEIKYR